MIEKMTTAYVAVTTVGRAAWPAIDPVLHRLATAASHPVSTREVKLTIRTQKPGRERALLPVSYCS